MIQTDTAPAPTTVRVDDLDISYHEIGSGPPLLMLHGTGPGASGWSNANTAVCDCASTSTLGSSALPLSGVSVAEENAMSSAFSVIDGVASSTSSVMVTRPSSVSVSACGVMATS